MRIVFLASAESVHSVRWIKYFSLNTNNEIIWVTTVYPNHETIDEYKILEKKVKIFNFKKIKNINNVVKELISAKNGLFHLHYIGWHSILLLLVNRKNKIILTPWGSDLLIKVNYLKKLWFKFIFKKSKAVICDSQRLLNLAIKFGAKKNNTYICNFGTDTDLYNKTRSIFSDSNKVVIGSNRRLEEIYDIDTFIKSAEYLIKEFKNISFLIAGNGSLKENLVKKVNEKNLQGSINFLGALNREEMIRFYNSIDIYVSTSLSDGGLSSSVAEAMSFERLVIVTRNSDNQKWIKDGENGFLFENKDYEGLFKIIKYNLINKNKAHIISKKAREVIYQNYSYKKEMQKVNTFYGKIYRY